MAALDHPQIAVLYGLEDWRGTPVLVVEYLPGGTLVELDYRLQPRMAVRAQTPPAQAWDYYNPAVRGFDAPQEVVVIGN